MQSSKLLLIFAGVVLATAVAFVVAGETLSRERRFHGAIKELLPKAEELPGWTVTYRPVAETPEMRKTVVEQLNYDDAF